MSRNQNRHRAKPNRFQRIYETVLAVSLCVLICYYLLMSLATYLLLGSQLRLQLYTAGKYAAIAFCTAGIVYILLTLFRFENTWYRISDFFRRFRRWDVLLAALLFVWFAVIDIHAQRAQHVKGISSNFLHNDDTRMYGVFMMGVLMYSAGRVFTGETRRKAMHAVAYALTAVATLFMLWILVNFFCGNLLIDFAEEQIGFTKRLSLDIGCNPNTTGAYAALLLALDLYMIAASKKKWVKGLYIFAAFIQLFPLYLSNSRTSLFASLAFCAVFAFFLVSKRCREPWSLRAILLSLLAAAAAGGVIYGLKYVIPDAFDRITDLSEKIGAVRGVEKAGLSGRPAIWNAALT
ncbi:MAG: hypothetical protein CW338_06780, partial [Clostridiales bacterium]|nr:hypothetical protein [Clostridiales bacterium]